MTSALIHEKIRPIYRVFTTLYPMHNNIFPRLAVQDKKNFYNIKNFVSLLMKIVFNPLKIIPSS